MFIKNGTHEEILRKTSEVNNYWGDKMPLMACEEAGEFIQAISKVERKENWKTRENLAEEIRDMFISCFCIMYRYGFSISEIEDMVWAKLNTKKES